MKRHWESFGIMVTLVLAGISPNIFPISAAGYSTMGELAEKFLIPSILALVVLEIFAWVKGWERLSKGILTGALGGIAGTVGLELVREIGFRFFHSMPGDLPMLMGVLLTNRMMLGPSLLSNMAGWGYHFWNGACFGIIYAFLFRWLRWWGGLIYGFLIGIGFMLSPVVVSLGVGLFGKDFGPGFAITVVAAHLVFGGILGLVVNRFQAQAGPSSP